ncbi:putative aminopeptidase W07G4.4-like [Apostichopus japonicus]|uniref:Putative aminopeptidase W07G4.4-like n=1 Tax=Stichopus japonicus TaxID=307972 RepID=A0A2G8LEB2_STIJA|nr:putative aminopeptidase W07G4.4-like [Apostichopus japonicus]
MCRLPCLVKAASLEDAKEYDGLVVVSPGVESLVGELAFAKAAVDNALKLDKSVSTRASLVHLPDHALGRMVFSPTGPLNRDYDDVRRFGEAANSGVKRALEAGFSKPLFVTVSEKEYPDGSLVSLLGALHALYVPIEIRENIEPRAQKVEALGVIDKSAETAKTLVEKAIAVESGRLVYRDIGGSDPERMAPPNVATYVNELFDSADSQVKVEVLSDLPAIEKNYPLFAAVNRCASLVNRHQGRIINLTYTGSGKIEKTLLLVGKGVTYDTGGADIKHGGHMAGMHRDKCGSAFVAGYFQTLNILRPQNIKVIGRMAMVRNSVGVESYVADEIITSRAGVRVRVGNTDAEGRMAMADPLCEMKELLVMDNGPAQKEEFAQSIQKFGHTIGDPFEISTIRRDDYDFCRGKSEYEDVLQCNNQPSSATPRGHQFPAAFLIVTSGLDKHGKDSSEPIKYTHIDIAGSSGPFPGTPTGAPIPAFTAKYLFNQ